METGYDGYSQSVKLFVKRASEVLVNAWSQCIKQTSSPGRVAVLVRHDSDPSTFSLLVNYTPVPKVSRAKVTFSFPDFVSCKDEAGRSVHSGRAIDAPANRRILRCKRDRGSGSTIGMSTDMAFVGDEEITLPTVKLRTDRFDQRYASCAMEHLVRDGKTVKSTAREHVAGDDLGGGGVQRKTITLEAPVNHQLRNVRAVCVGLSGHNPCAFVRGMENIRTLVPAKKFAIDISTDSDRANVALRAELWEEVPLPQTLKDGISLTYGRTVELVVPAGSLDPSLSCKTVQGADKRFLIADLERAVAVAETVVSPAQLFLEDTPPVGQGKFLKARVQRFDVDVFR